MAARFYTPSEQFADASGTPYAGGFLYFYASGTPTPLNTYSDSALTVANANPVPLDSAGRPQTDIFLQNLAYKCTLTDSALNPIWTKDPVYTSDFSAAAQFQSGSGNPNGIVAGSAGSATIKASAYWDYTNAILYVCTTTGTATTAVWTAVNASTAANVVQVPTGRLTLTSGTPVLSSDVVGATAVIYTTYNGNTVPIYNGSSITNQTYSELTLTLNATAHAANTLYDVFVFNNSGVLTLVTGPAWAVSTPGSGARGSGAGTTQLTRIGGILFNAVQMTAKNGTTTYTINANLATFLGSIYIDAVAGQVSCYFSWGQNRKCGLSNAYNRVLLVMQGGDPTANWTYNSDIFRQSNGSAANTITTFCCLPEEIISAKFSQAVMFDPVTTSGIYMAIGIGINSTITYSGINAMLGNYLGAGSNWRWMTSTITASCDLPPTIGINNFNSLERGSSAAGTTSSFIGTAPSMRMEVSYRW